METIQYFLSKMVLLMVILGTILFAYLLVQKFAPDFMKKFSITGPGVSFFTDNWLPDPVNLQEITKPKIADLSLNVYEGGMTPGTSYVIYTENGMKIVNVPPKAPVFNSQTAGFSDNSLYVRNLSIYTGESLRTNSVFSGEARSTFFKNGTFPIYITDNQGRIFARENAVSTGQWSVPGWIRFNVQIHSLLPNHAPCQVLFIPDPASPDSNTGWRAQVPVSCN